MLGLLPAEDRATLRAVVLRQPTRKQCVLSAIWGRLDYSFDFGPVHGPAVILEAQPKGNVFQLPRSRSVEDAEELERLRTDGHALSRGRRWRIQTTPASTRSTQLFRTLPHEVGHLVHYRREVEQRAGSDEFPDPLVAFFSRPQREREDFAHRYAREAVERLSAEGHVPFPRIVDEASMRRWGVDPRWFGLA